MFTSLQQALFKRTVVTFFLLLACLLISLTTLHQKFRSKTKSFSSESRHRLFPKTKRTESNLPSFPSRAPSRMGRQHRHTSEKAFQLMSRNYVDPNFPVSAYDPMSYIPESPEENVCWIFTCTDRQLQYSQKFKGKGFRHIHLGMPAFIAQETLHPVWCRVGFLRDIMNVGQRCVIYTDDDVYLNLTSLQLAIKSHPAGSIMATSADEHGMKYHINAGLLVFTDIQCKLARYVVESWYVSRLQPSKVPLGYLRDQAALNRIITCRFPGVVCYNRSRIGKYRIGYLKHCFSHMEKRRSGAEAECMKSMKKVVAPWDAESNFSTHLHPNEHVRADEDISQQ